MCGIIGLYQKNKIIEKKILQRMASKTAHRGPDNTGYFLSEDYSIGLVHNRLSILDLSPAGNQPMFIDNQKYTTVFNGEIYNHREIRKDILKNYNNFFSTADTETLLYLYKEYREKMLNVLNGMFSFCIYDKEQNKLFIARDRVGIKPLYYVHQANNFAFASEIKPLLELDWVSKDINQCAVDAYFTLGYIPQDMSIYKAINKLKPAHYLSYDINSSKLSLVKYWDLPNVDLHSRNNLNEHDLEEKLYSLLSKSVSKRLISDVPIGCFLSGGLDSSMVAAIMSKVSPAQIKTFTIGFDIDKYDESKYASIVAHDIHSEHHTHKVSIDAAGTLLHLIKYFDEPFADSSMIPTYLVSKFAREYVTVILSGDGGDELFGGYNWYSWMLKLDTLKKRLGLFSLPVSGMADFLPYKFPGKNLLKDINQSREVQFLNRVGIINKDLRKKLFSKQLYNTVLKENFNFQLESEEELLSCISRTDFKTYLPEDILTKVDRASMATSLEARVPWLDHELVEFAFSLPSNLKIKDSRKKYLPKLLAQKILPKELPIERKQGFNIPVCEWMKSDLKKILEENLNSSIYEYICEKQIRTMISQHCSGKINYGKELFSILNFVLWYNEYH